MNLILAAITTRKPAKDSPADALTHDYVTRAQRLNPTELQLHPTEAALLDSLERRPNRPAATLILFDSRGSLPTSPDLAELLRTHRDASTPRLVFAIGPADGWSPAAFTRAAATLSFGRITLPHSLARAVAAEQLYRALTILAGHPYHSGH